MLDNITEITAPKLLGVAQRMIFEGYRFVTTTCVDNGDDTFDLIYHFDKEMQLQNFRLTVNKSEEVHSISRIYFCSLFVENEIKELFGVKITDIVLDYEGKLLLSEGAPLTPMAGGGQLIIERQEEQHA